MRYFMEVGRFVTEISQERYEQLRRTLKANDVWVRLWVQP